LSLIYFLKYSLRITRTTSGTVSNILAFRSFSNAFCISSGTDTNIRFIAIYYVISIGIFIRVLLYYINRYLMKSDNKCNRIDAGKKIFENPNVQILRLSEHHYTVKSQTTNRKYDVIGTESGFICNCPDHTFRKICCKHIHGVEFSIKYRNEVRESNKITITQLDVTV